MKVLSSHFLSGPNLYYRDSAAVIVCDLSDMPGMAELIAANAAAPLSGEAPAPLRPLEALLRQAAGAGRPAHEQMLHAALALISETAVSPSTLSGRILQLSGPAVTAVLRCDAGAVGLAAWQLALSGGYYFLAGPHDPARRAVLERELAALYEGFRAAVQQHSLDIFTLAMVREAARRDIPWARLGTVVQGFVQLGHGRHRQRLHETMIESTKFFPVRLTQDKAATSQYLHMLGFPVPRQHLVSTADAAVNAAAQIGYPVVLKPRRGGKGQGVSVGLANEQQVRVAFPAAAQGGAGVVVESVVAGDDHRLLVAGGKLTAAARRLPAHVVGDGRSTVAELVARLNRDPRRGSGIEKLLVAVELDREAVETLSAQKMTPASVPAFGQKAWLRRTANISRGGTSQDVTGTMHPDNVRLAEEVAAAVGLDVTGIDFLTRDIARSWKEIGGGIIEVNSNPGLRPHWVADRKRDVVGPILDLIFPPGAPSRVPTAAVTGSMGKTTTCRMTAAILAAAGYRTGFSTTQGIYLDGRQLRSGDCAGGTAARHLLMQPGLEAGVFEMARGGLIKSGMGIDRCDVGAVLNVRDNHIGLDGVQDREGLARVKRIVAENAGEMVVLNADDPLCLAMREHVRSRRLCLFSAQEANPEVEAHRAAGGCCAVIGGEGAEARIVLSEGREEIGSLPVAEIPATLGGAATPKIINAAFAVAIAHGLGVPFETAAEALRLFDSSYDSNPGRQNFYRGLPFEVMLDWLDGPEAAKELAGIAARLPVTGRRILLLTAMGNRPDDFLINTGKALAAGFDGFVCSDYADLRGRAPGDVPALLRRGLAEGGAQEAAVRCIGDFWQALDAALDSAQAGDLLVVVTYASDQAWSRITAYQPQRLSA